MTIDYCNLWVEEWNHDKTVGPTGPTLLYAGTRGVLERAAYPAVNV